MASQSLWYKTDHDSGVEDALVAPSDASLLAVVGDDGTELTSTTSTPGADLTNESSPLATLGSLQAALPDVSGKSDDDNNQDTTD